MITTNVSPNMAATTIPGVLSLYILGAVTADVSTNMAALHSFSDSCRCLVHFGVKIISQLHCCNKIVAIDCTSMKKESAKILFRKYFLFKKIFKTIKIK